MTLEEFRTLLDRLQVAVAYHAFPVGQAEEPPFIVYYVLEERSFHADNIVYYQSKTVVVELYTETKQPLLEEQLEQILTENSLVFDKSEAYIDTENFILISYEVEEI